MPDKLPEGFELDDGGLPPGFVVDEPASNPALAIPRAQAGAFAGLMTGALSQIPAGLAGIGAAIVPGGRTGAEAVEDVSSALTYRPRTELGRRVIGNVSSIFQPLESAADYLGEDVALNSPTGRDFPAVGAGVKAALLTAPSLIGARGRPRPKTTRQNTLIKAQEKGYVVPPASDNQGIVAGVLEGAGGKIKTGMQASARNQANTNRLVVRELGLPDGTELSRDVLSAARSRVAPVYERVKQIGDLTVDTQFRRDLSVATRDARQVAGEFPGIVDKSLLDLYGQLQGKQQISSGTAVELIRQIRDKADTAFRQGERNLGNKLRDMSRAVEDLIERDLNRRGGPGADLLNEYRDARQYVAKTYSVEDALDGSSVSAPRLAAQLNKGQPLSGSLRDIAEFAAEFPKAARVMKESVPSFSVLDAISVGGFGAASSLNPAFLAPVAYELSRPLIRGVALGRAGQAAARPGPSAPSGAGLLASGMASNPLEQYQSERLNQGLL